MPPAAWRRRSCEAQDDLFQADEDLQTFSYLTLLLPSTLPLYFSLENFDNSLSSLWSSLVNVTTALQPVVAGATEYTPYGQIGRQPVQLNAQSLTIADSLLAQIEASPTASATTSVGQSASTDAVEQDGGSHPATIRTNGDHLQPDDISLAGQLLIYAGAVAIGYASSGPVAAVVLGGIAVAAMTGIISMVAGEMNTLFKEVLTAALTNDTSPIQQSISNLESNVSNAVGQIESEVMSFLGKASPEQTGQQIEKVDSGAAAVPSSGTPTLEQMIPQLSQYRERCQTAARVAVQSAHDFSYPCR